VVTQDTLSAREYNELMMDRLDEVTDIQLMALREIEKVKLRTARAYNRRVRENHFRLMIWYGK
jgi:hypothetical protein